MEFLLLGPIRVRIADREFPVAGQRQQALLAVLLLRAGRSVSLAELVDAIWGDDPPETARSQVHNTVWHLRRALGRHGADALVQNEPFGYRLAVAANAVDAHRFQAAVAEGRRLRSTGDLAGSARIVRTALALWRGPALDGVDETGLRREAARLNELRVSAWEECIECELQARVGDTDPAAELATLVAEHPLRERLVAALMLAWYRAGRQAEALALYRRTADMLRDELGVDPGPDLTDRFAAILRRDPDLNIDTPNGDKPSSDKPNGDQESDVVRPAQLPAPSAYFVGRGAELAQLDEWLVEAERPGAASLVVTIQGAGGVGKTTLALHWAHRVAPRFVDGQLYVNLQGFAPSGSAVTATDALRAMLEALGIPSAQLPSDVDARSGLLRTTLTGRRLLIVLDNARQAEQVQPLLPGSSGCVVLITSRNQLSSLAAVADARPLPIGVLSPADARELLVRRLGAARISSQSAASDDIVSLCAGLPLALAVVAARAATNPHFDLDALAAELREAHRRLDALDGGEPVADVRAVFSASYRRLSEPAARLFRLLGVHPGPDVSAPAAASVAGVTLTEVRALLAELTGAHVLIEVRPGRYGFHDLLRAYAGELVRDDEERMPATIRMIDHYLHTAYPANRLIIPSREPITVGPCADGVVPERFDGPEPAAAWLVEELPVLTATVTVAEAAGEAWRTWELVWSLSTTLVRRTYFDTWIEVGLIALGATERTGDTLAQAHAHRMMGTAYNAVDRHDDAREQLLLAIERYRELGDLSGMARTHNNIGVLREKVGQLTEAIAHAQKARELYEQVGNRHGVGQALNYEGWWLTLNGDHEKAIVVCQEALALAEEFDDVEGVADALDSIGRAYGYLGDRQQAVTYIRRGIECYRSIGDHYNESEALIRLGDYWHEIGDTELARGAWQEALAIREQIGGADIEKLRAKLDQTSVVGAQLPDAGTRQP